MAEGSRWGTPGQLVEGTVEGQAGETVRRAADRGRAKGNAENKAGEVVPALLSLTMFED
jgi:hypothetical protein